MWANMLEGSVSSNRIDVMQSYTAHTPHDLPGGTHNRNAPQWRVSRGWPPVADEIGQTRKDRNPS